eukprot:CAMPEP_0171185282 /NCGR_PEP_ID=MMETSP0790-20130122/16222_1 /TAXON_ID=2925 /ORGANISM="Alexandrium catenella, Strain OF101" /LENGTH=57 /DNA_ID=CAMNT_0011650301 /DNA_START=105 /DNA_END=274 /DNA_ORIENTATION=-
MSFNKQRVAEAHQQPCARNGLSDRASNRHEDLACLRHAALRKLRSTTAAETGTGTRT